MTTPADLASDLARFGLTAFRPGQEQVIRTLLEGRSVLAVFPTGGGKSLCYQLPAPRFDGLTLVVSPLLALMKDQVDSLARLSISAGRLDSTLSANDYHIVSTHVQSGELKLLYVTPERLRDERFMTILRSRRLSLVAIDEAHCLSEWGHSFRPDYLRLPGLCRDLRAERVLALTATATPQVVGDVAAAFSVGPADIVRTRLYRPNLKLLPNPTPPDRRVGALLQRFRGRAPGATIVYCTTRGTAEEVADKLAANGWPAEPYHAGMDPATREATQDRFMTKRNRVVVATIAFGMGIDKRDLRYVYHYDLPKSVENYAQEIGRAGRDGNEAVCECLGSAADADDLCFFARNDAPSPEALTSALDEVLGAGHEFELSTRSLAMRTGMQPLTIETLLTYMEIDGLLQLTGTRWPEMSFRPNKPLDNLPAGWDSERQRLLSDVLRRANKKKTWYYLDIATAAQATGGTCESIQNAFWRLQDRGDLTLKPSVPRQVFRKSQQPIDRDQAASKLAHRFGERERLAVERVGQMVRFVTGPGCATRALLAHFGEDLGKNCGHCGLCQGSASWSITGLLKRLAGF